MLKTGWLLIVFVVLVLTQVVSVQAHEIEVERSDPPADAVLEQAPGEVVLWFNEEVQSDGSTVEVFNSQGERVDNQDGGVDLNDPAHASMRVTLPSLPGGAYTVRWHALLPDGDESEGEFGFFDGTTAESTEQAACPKTGGENTRCLSSGIGSALIFLSLVFFLKKQTYH